MLNTLKTLRETSTEEGFTLIELMVVVVIIGILAAVAIPLFANQQKSAIASTVVSDVKNTNLNITTYLVTDPGAPASALTAAKVGSAATATGSGAGNFDIVVSDVNTTITVTGAWNNYTVRGTNTAVGAGNVTFSVATGAIANTFNA